MCYHDLGTYVFFRVYKILLKFMILVDKFLKHNLFTVFKELICKEVTTKKSEVFDSIFIHVQNSDRSKSPKFSCVKISIIRFFYRNEERHVYG